MNALAAAAFATVLAGAQLAAQRPLFVDSRRLGATLTNTVREPVVAQ